MRRTIYKSTYTLLVATLLLSNIQLAEAARLFLYPDSIILEEGESSIFDLYLDTEGENIGAIEINGEVNGELTLEEVNNPGSLVEVFIEQPSDENNFKFVRDIFLLVKKIRSGELFFLMQVKHRVQAIFLHISYGCRVLQAKK